MKKILFVTAIVVLVFSFASCSVEKATKENSNEKQVEKKTEDSKSGEVQSLVSVTGDEARKLIKDDNAVLVDVRTKEEYDDRHIDGATLIPLDELESIVDEKLPDKEQAVIVYCRSGRRSGIASKILLEKGYKKIYDLGAIGSW